MLARTTQADTKPFRPIKVFISYAKEDQKMLDKLINHLSLLKQENLIQDWYDRKILPGKDWRSEVDDHLKDAQIVLLLVSANFIASYYLIGVEMEKALAKHRAKEAHVIPVILRAVDWKNSPLGDLKELPTNDKPVTGWSNIDEAFVDVVKGIRAVIEELHRSGYPPSSAVPFTAPPAIPTDENHIHQRKDDVEKIFARLSNPNTSALVLTGIGGIGKSTLAALVRDRVEKSRSANTGQFRAKTLWLEVAPTFTMLGIAEPLLRYLKKPLPNLWSLSPQSLASVLVHALQTAENPCLVVLDRFDNLLDTQKGETHREPGIKAWLEELNSKPCSCKVLLTSRSLPETYHTATYLKEYPVKSFEGAEGLVFLEKQGVKSSNRDLPALQAAIDACGGHALSLKFLASKLRRNPAATLSTVLPPFTLLSMEEVAEQLLKENYQGLNEIQRKLLLAFSIFREPVPLQAAQEIISASEVQVMEALNVLLSKYLIEARGKDLYQPHSIVSHYVLRHTSHTNKVNAHTKAALFYQQKQQEYPALKIRRHINDIQPLIEEVWHRCQAEQWLLAFELMRKEDMFSSLKRWGNYAVLLDLCLQLANTKRWQAKPWQEVFIVNNLGEMHDKLWQKDEAAKCFTRALRLYRQEAKDPHKEFKVLNNLASIYQTLNDEEKAQRFYQMAWELAKLQNDTTGEGAVLNGLGQLQQALGKRKEAVDYYEKALNAFEKCGNSRQGARTRRLMADAYIGLGEEEKAEQSYKEALNIYQQLNDNKGEIETLNKLGELYLGQGKRIEAQKHLEEALRILQRLADRAGEAEVSLNLGELYHNQGMREEAQRYYERALEIARETGNRNGEAKSLNNLGRIYDDLQKREDALKYYEVALAIFKEVGDHKGEGQTLYNLGTHYYSHISSKLSLSEAVPQDAEEAIKKEVIEKYEEALSRLKQAGDLKGESWILNNLGSIYDRLGQKGQARDHLRQAYDIYKKVDEQAGQGIAYHNIGILYISQRQDVALASFLLAKEIFEHIQSPRSKETGKRIDELEHRMKKNQFDALKARTQPHLIKIVEQALQENI